MNKRSQILYGNLKGIEWEFYFQLCFDILVASPNLPYFTDFEDSYRVRMYSIKAVVVIGLIKV